MERECRIMENRTFKKEKIKSIEKALDLLWKIEHLKKKK